MAEEHLHTFSLGYLGYGLPSSSNLRLAPGKTCKAGPNTYDMLEGRHPRVLRFSAPGLQSTAQQPKQYDMCAAPLGLERAGCLINGE